MTGKGEDRSKRFVLDTDKGITVTPPPPAVRELTDKAEAAADVVGGLDADAAAEALKDEG